MAAESGRTGGSHTFALATALAAAGCLDSPGGGGDDELAIESLCLIATITVDVTILHSFRGDVEIALEGPQLDYVRLKQLDLADEEPDIIGNYPESLEPVDSLSTFVAGEAKGTWTLVVADVGVEDEGTLRSWGLNLTGQ